MTRDWEEDFKRWAKPPSKSEEQRMDNAIRMIGNAIKNSLKLKYKNIVPFRQGSYRNRVNVRQDSDVDVGVLLADMFFFDLPPGKTLADFSKGYSSYRFEEFKDDLHNCLVDHFGPDAVERGNKAFKIKANSYRVQADVTPFCEFRKYALRRIELCGVALRTDKGVRIVNYPEKLIATWPDIPLHYENGCIKNTITHRRFKSVVRILKKLRNEMKDNGFSVFAGPVPGYLLECMTWNIGNDHFEKDLWFERVKDVLYCMKFHTRSDASCDSWCEVDNIKKLFSTGQPWNRMIAHLFICDARNYIGVS